MKSRIENFFGKSYFVDPKGEYALVFFEDKKFVHVEYNNGFRKVIPQSEISREKISVEEQEALLFDFIMSKI